MEFPDTGECYDFCYERFEKIIWWSGRRASKKNWNREKIILI